jgi:hypothetical protein
MQSTYTHHLLLPECFSDSVKEKLCRQSKPLPTGIKEKAATLVPGTVQLLCHNIQKSYQQNAKKYKLCLFDWLQEGKLCATPFGVDVVGITELFALVGGIYAVHLTNTRAHTHTHRRYPANVNRSAKACFNVTPDILPVYQNSPTIATASNPLKRLFKLCIKVGAVVGGVSARQRKDELERLNEQLRKINLSLRQQARAGTLYAPGATRNLGLARIMIVQ